MAGNLPGLVPTNERTSYISSVPAEYVRSKTRCWKSTSQWNDMYPAYLEEVYHLRSQPAEFPPLIDSFIRHNDSAVPGIPTEVVPRAR
ncbi:BZ3500_MvSof-1268-A1-R1_Chr9g10901 [Microbotryum saponariae]|uniref:BZ3500_MvSof-1268-A1-R1_Chr9g10901 protein n=1 Tax=Microbotryum saponariae TaxID=289078 RepID=A0A2X0L8B5_9BASI|nr:BZ3501_MvSof-1269-A2-R1_Chr9g10649 [Microbotryum saponariae]SDA00888.1 BZ3500_MvSof-1268-A1-R1_Chr9g10901 [Microbotryum saponariae]